MKRIFLLSMMFICAPYAQAHDDDLSLPLSDTVTIKRIYESCFAMKAGEALSYSYAATGPLDFNIHYHEGDEVLYLVTEKEQFTAEAAVDIPADAEICLMWENKTAISAKLSFDASIPPNN